MSHNIDLNVMNMRTDLAIDGVNNEELEKLKEANYDFYKEDNVYDIVHSILEQEEIGPYDRYSSLYKGNIDRLADEARAKLLAKHIIRNEEIKASP